MDLAMSIPSIVPVLPHPALRERKKLVILEPKYIIQHSNVCGNLYPFKVVSRTFLTHTHKHTCTHTHTYMYTHTHLQLNRQTDLPAVNKNWYFEPLTIVMDHLYQLQDGVSRRGFAMVRPRQVVVLTNVLLFLQRTRTLIWFTRSQLTQLTPSHSASRSLMIHTHTPQNSTYPLTLC